MTKKVWPPLLYRISEKNVSDLCVDGHAVGAGVIGHADPVLVEIVGAQVPDLGPRIVQGPLPVIRRWVSATKQQSQRAIVLWFWRIEAVLGFTLEWRFATQTNPRFRLVDVEDVEVSILNRNAESN